MIRHVTDTLSVAPQIAPEDMAAIRAAGFVAIINNRPDGEEPGQPTGDAIAAAAKEQGLAYTAIPVTPGGLSQIQLDAMADALAKADGPVLAFCRSGTRSCNLWALASAKTGGDPDEIIASGANAGYELSGIRSMLDTLSGNS